jgi:predicted dinucleotide-binding enzyme
MKVAVIGTGFVGGTLGRALARAGHEVTFGSRNPEGAAVAGDTGARVALVVESLESADVVILAVPSSVVAALVSEQAGRLGGKLVIDATNRMGVAVANSRAALPPDVRYARAFNIVGGENMAAPSFSDGLADMFFTCREADRTTVDEVVRATGMRPVYIGADQEELMDALFKLWIALAIGQRRGRRLAFRLLEG